MAILCGKTHPSLVGLAGGRRATWLKIENFVPMDNVQTPLDDDPPHGIKDLANDNVNSRKDSTKKVTDTDIVTLEPYIFSQKERTNVQDKTTEGNNSKYRRRKYKVDPTLIHFDTLFGSDSWSRFLVFKTETEITAAKLENLLLSKCPTRELSFRSVNRKEWLVETTTRIQSETFQSLDSLNGIKVTVQRHDKLNSIEGTVILPHNNDFDGLPDEKILLESLKLRYPNVENIKVYEIPSKRQTGNKLRVARIKFEGHILPSNIKIEGQKRELLPYIPKPLQCKNCSKYGHTESKCRNPAACAFCGSEKHKTTWDCGIQKCLNCGQDHHARSKICPFYIYNTELKLLVSRTGMSIQEAKLELKSKGFLDPARNPTYRDAARAKPPVDSTKLNIEIDQKQPQELEIPNKNIDIDKEKVDINVPVTNRYEILNQDNEEEPMIEIHVEDETNTTTKKRNREQNSPPKINENSAAAKRRILRLNRQKSSEDDMIDDVSPSPVFQSRFANMMKVTKDELENKKCQCQQCSQEEVPLQIGNHHERCGCNDCFLQDCKETKPLTKDKLRNVVRNFLSRKDSSGILSPLESHAEDCMCIKHLHYYRVSKIAVLDNFIAKLDHNSSQSETNIEPKISNNQTENKSVK